MKKLIIYTFSLILILFLAYTSFKYFERKKYEDLGNELINKIEKYSTTNGKLPESAKDLNLNIEMDEGPYYKKLDDNTYEVYFNIGLDNSTIIYKSNSKNWKFKE
jgi:hypothetical protein